MSKKSQVIAKSDKLDIASERQITGFEFSASDKILPQLGDYCGILLISSAVLLFELALTRIFAVILWAHLAFMVVSTALFGFGLSGVFLALRPQTLIGHKRSNFPLLSLFVSISIVAAYAIITALPFKMWSFQEDPLNYVYLAVWYIALVLPFFFAGLLIAELLSKFPMRASRLYGVDLLGAAFGSLLLIPVIPVLGGEGTVILAAILAAVSGVCFCWGDNSGLGKAKLLVPLMLTILVLGIILPKADTVIPLKYHQNKRRYNKAIAKNKILETRWSPLSKVDIAKHKPGIYDIWIDGGTNESAIIAWTGNMETLKPLEWSSIGLVHKLKQGTDQEVMIIGPSGGKEVLFALSHGANHVDAVELDPSIVALVNTSPYKEFMGELYQNKKVTLVNDEGRAYLRRQVPERYDIIQFVNNYTPVAIAAGALNLSETFLITKEAFHDFLNHLRPGGILALHRGATLRVALTAIEALRERGVENPEKHILITAGEVPFFEGFLLKKGEWTKEEEEAVHSYMKVRRRVGGKTFLWTPFDPGRKNLYSRLLSASPEEQRASYTNLGINLFPATDDQPFVEHYLQLGKRKLSKDIPIEYVHRNKQKWRGLIPRGDFPYVAILVESAVLGLLFVGLPLFFKARSSLGSQGFLGYLFYFAALGFGFIVVEICLMKRYVLFLGNPAYSITTILVAVLLGAGIGSTFSERFANRSPRKAISTVIPLIAALIACETWLSPIVFDACLGLSFAGRVAVATLMLLPLGFVMGMPFPLGLRLISNNHSNPLERTQLTAWAWGMNGYFTVIGSASTVFLALFFGFKAALMMGVATYLFGLFAVLLGTPKHA